jgi:hypothetical protein
MFETLFSFPAVIRRHREGPFAAERATYLEGLAAKGMTQGTILRCARYCLCVAKELQRWPPDHCFDEEEIKELASAWAAERVASGRACKARWPTERFRFTATGFLSTLSRLRCPPSPQSGRYDDKLADYIATQQEGRWLSEATCRSTRWQVTRFLYVFRGSFDDLTALMRTDAHDKNTDNRLSGFQPTTHLAWPAAATKTTTT